MKKFEPEVSWIGIEKNNCVKNILLQLMCFNQVTMKK